MNDIARLFQAFLAPAIIISATAKNSARAAIFAVSPYDVFVFTALLR